MIIRKTFKFELAHRVRNCTTARCSKSMHGHSFKVETFFTATGLDNGQMICDFSIIKKAIHDFIDSFDHAFAIWSKESNETKQIIQQLSERWIEIPYSPSAESLSILFFRVIDDIINRTIFANNEYTVRLFAVRIHETETGYAEARREDLSMLPFFQLTDIVFSDAVKKDWKYNFIEENIRMSTPEQQIK